MDPTQLRQLIIEPTLRYLDLWSAGAETLLLATCAQETHCGDYIAQVHGPALGIYQCEPATHRDIWQNFLAANSGLSAMVRDLAASRWQGQNVPSSELVGNLCYATAICRVHYLRAPAPLPAPQDIGAVWDYYKNYYNSAGGAATEQEFRDNWRRYVA